MTFWLQILQIGLVTFLKIGQSHYRYIFVHLNNLLPILVFFWIFLENFALDRIEPYY